MASEATVFFQGSNELATLTNTFMVNGVATDPTTVALVVTDPTNALSNFAYNPGSIVRVSAGVYSQTVPCTLAGRWGFTWTGTGTASDVQVGSFTVQPTSVQQFYCTVEELKSRVNISDTTHDFELLSAVRAASRWIEGKTGRYFFQNTATRTLIADDIWTISLPDLVSVTTFKIDRDGDGVFEETWVQGTDYELFTAPWEVPQDLSGETRPFRHARVIGFGGSGGKFFPFTWPFTRLDRVQIAGVWGWPQVPDAVHEASLMVAESFFKSKDAPFGIAGSSEFGMIRVPRSNPMALSLLTPYRDSKRAVGV